MRNYIENYQFYYVNDVIDFSNITGEIDEIVVEYITKRLSEVRLLIFLAKALTISKNRCLNGRLLI